MLRGALRELTIGDPAELATDIGPVIDDEARTRLEAHVAQLQAKHRVERLPLPAAAAAGTFVAPTLIEIDSLAALEREVFGPVLHVLRYQRAGLGALIDAINAGGYGLTFGVHSRIDETIDFVAARIRAGNLYVNRNMIGAVVGVQPFGGLGLSGTGPKAGGPLMLPRLRRAAQAPLPAGTAPASLGVLQAWARTSGRSTLAEHCAALAKATPLGAELTLPGPTGESNRLRFVPRGRALCLAADDDELLRQLAAALACGNGAVLCAPGAEALRQSLPAELRLLVMATPDAATAAADVALAVPAQAVALRRLLAAREGARIRVVTPQGGDYPAEALLIEQTMTVNTAAAGGNASLMTLAPA